MIKVPKFITPKVFAFTSKFRKRGRWLGFATPFAIFLAEDNPRYERHEREHVKQMWRGLIVFFMIKYLYYLWKYDYWNNPYEISARAAEHDD